MVLTMLALPYIKCFLRKLLINCIFLEEHCLHRINDIQFGRAMKFYFLKLNWRRLKSSVLVGWLVTWRNWKQKERKNIFCDKAINKFPLRNLERQKKLFVSYSEYLAIMTRCNLSLMVTRARRWRKKLKLVKVKSFLWSFISGSKKKIASSSPIKAQNILPYMRTH